MDQAITRKVNDEGKTEYFVNGEKISINQDELIDIMGLAFAHIKQLFRLAIEISDDDPIADIGLCLVEHWEKKVDTAWKFILLNHGRVRLNCSASFVPGHVEYDDIVGLEFLPANGGAE